MPKKFQETLIFKVITPFLLVMFFFGPKSSFAIKDVDTYVFLGNHNIPPFIFLQNGEPAGLVIDIANVLAQKSNLNIEVQAMDWSEAQAKVLKGEADALLQINKNTEREPLYDFSEPLLESRFSIFRKNSRTDLVNIKALFGLTVGVEANGYPIALMKKYPKIKVKIIPTWKTGFELVNTGQIEAVIVDRWVGEYQLAINNIPGITVVDEPVEISHSRIAVRKGNRLLLDRINEGLKKISEDGSMNQILKKWSKKEVIYLSREQFQHYKLTIMLTVLSVVLVLIIMAIIIIWNRRLNKEIAEHKQTEAALHREKCFTEAIFESIPGILYVYDDQAKLVRWNKKHETMTGYSAEELAQMTSPDWHPEEEQAQVAKAVELVMTTGYGMVEAHLLTKDSKNPLMQLNGVRLNLDGKTYFVGIGIDITDRKQTEEKIMASLREKELLLKEIHHRVKNNLQIITSLLKLQANYIDDEQVKEHFRECQQRIAAMADVHTLLYKSQNFAAINFEDYVRRMTNQLLQAYRTSTAAIGLVILMEEVMLPIDSAIPCGLLINELITNALKYAFPAARKGEISIEMQQTAEGGAKLIFADNGIGFPKDVDFRTTETFGLKLVQMLVRQLDGSIEQFLDGGTRYVIMFKPATTQEIEHV